MSEASASPTSDLGAMWQEMERAPAIVQPSDFWQGLNERNTRQLDEQGFRHFKRTVNQNYFSWIPHALRDDQFLAVLKAWLRRPDPRVFTVKLGDVSTLEAGDTRHNPFRDRKPRAIHALFLALLWERVRHRDRLGLAARLEEPDLGDPVVAAYRGRQISQDLSNSVHELSSMAEGFGPEGPGGTGVLELGAGYGRVAWVFMHAFPDTRYIVCDIPPALGIAQEYLTRLFPDRPTFRFRHFDDPAEVEAELAESKLAFLTPNQLDLLPPLGLGLFVNISSLHEMRRDQVAHYLQEVDRHTDGLFYTKQWKRWHNPDDDVEIRREDYPIPNHWNALYSRDHDVQTQFFEALYRVRP